MPHWLTLLYDYGLDEDINALGLDIDVNERNNVDNLVSVKSDALHSVFCDVSTLLLNEIIFFSL